MKKVSFPISTAALFRVQKFEIRFCVVRDRLVLVWSDSRLPLCINSKLLDFHSGCCSGSGGWSFCILTQCLGSLPWEKVELLGEGVPPVVDWRVVPSDLAPFSIDVSFCLELDAGERRGVRLLYATSYCFHTQSAPFQGKVSFPFPPKLSPWNSQPYISRLGSGRPEIGE